MVCLRRCALARCTQFVLPTQIKWIEQLGVSVHSKEYHAIFASLKYLKFSMKIYILENHYLVVQIEKKWRASIKWYAPSRWSFRPISAWRSIETTTMRKTHSTLLVKK